MRLFKHTIDDWRREARKTDRTYSGSVYHKIKGDFETYMIYSFNKDDTQWKAILQVAHKKMSDAVDAEDWETATTAQELLNYQKTLDECRNMLVEAGLDASTAEMRQLSTNLKLVRVRSFRKIGDVFSAER